MSVEPMNELNNSDKSKFLDCSPGLGVRQTWDHILALLLTSHVTLAKLPPCSKSLVFPSVKWAQS